MAVENSQKTDEKIMRLEVIKSITKSRVRVKDNKKEEYKARLYKKTFEKDDIISAIERRTKNTMRGKLAKQGRRKLANQREKLINIQE